MSFVIPYVLHADAICDWIVERLEQILIREKPQAEEISLDECKARLVEEFKSKRCGEAVE